MQPKLFCVIKRINWGQSVRCHPLPLGTTWIKSDMIIMVHPVAMRQGTMIYFTGNSILLKSFMFPWCNVKVYDFDISKAKFKSNEGVMYVMQYTDLSLHQKVYVTPIQKKRHQKKRRQKQDLTIRKIPFAEGTYYNNFMWYSVVCFFLFTLSLIFHRKTVLVIPYYILSLLKIANIFVFNLHRKIVYLWCNIGDLLKIANTFLGKQCACDTIL